MVGRHVRPRSHRQHGGGFTEIGDGAPYTGDAEQRLVRLGEQPLVLQLLGHVGRCGELVEAVSQDRISSGGESAALLGKLYTGFLSGTGQLQRRCTSSTEPASPAAARTIGAVSVMRMSSRGWMFGTPSGKRRVGNRRDEKRSNGNIHRDRNVLTAAAHHATPLGPGAWIGQRLILAKVIEC